jgi:hypothetical protein
MQSLCFSCVRAPTMRGVGSAKHSRGITLKVSRPKLEYSVYVRKKKTTEKRNDDDGSEIELKYERRKKKKNRSTTDKDEFAHLFGAFRRVFATTTIILATCVRCQHVRRRSARFYCRFYRAPRLSRLFTRTGYNHYCCYYDTIIVIIIIIIII